MKFFTTLLLLALVGANSVKAFSAQVSFDNALISYLLRPNNAFEPANNPNYAPQCFQYYLPILNEITNTYSVNYQACIKLAEDQTGNLVKQADQNRTNLKQDVDDICSAYGNCDEKDNLGFFDCYAKVSHKEVSLVYNIEFEATSNGNTLYKGMQQIQENQESCTNATQRAYVEDTAATHKKLDECMVNGLPGDTSSSTTTTTAQPEEPTTEGTTEEPEETSTEGPEETTEEPEETTNEGPEETTEDPEQ